MAFYYTLCFNIHQPILYFACIFFFNLITAVIFDLLVLIPEITQVLRSVSSIAVFFKMVHIIIINVYLLCPMISAPILPNISLRWS